MDLRRVTFGEWLSTWFDTYKKPYLKPYSLRNIEQMIRLHTPEWLKEMKMRSITVFDVERALSEIPVGRTYVYAKQVWSAAFEKAMKVGIVKTNVLKLTDKVSYRKKKSKALTLQEQSEFIKALEKSRYKWVFLFYLYSGVRRAEALTLEWSDIDNGSQLILIKGTKTEGSYRYIILTEDLKRILRGQKAQNKKEGFIGTNVFPFSLQRVSKAFKSLCPEHHLHDLRHTYITRCAECGMSVTVCQQLVGHATVDMTMNVYTHVMDEFKRKEAMKFTIFPQL